MFLCWVGIHKYELREIHPVEKIDKPTFKVCIIQRCVRCKDSKITSKILDTTIVVSKKYL